jgi:hypothetical protein
MVATPSATVTNKPDHRGEPEISRKTIARGMPGETGVTVVTTLVCFLYFAYEAAGASSARHSLRPLNRGLRKFLANLGRNARRDCEAVSQRHCEERSDEAIHSCCCMDCFASLAMTISKLFCLGCLKIEVMCESAL